MPENSTIRCGAFRCGKEFTPRAEVCAGVIPICPSCEERMNEGIMQTLHEHSGKIRGHWHEVEGFKEE